MFSWSVKDGDDESLFTIAPDGTRLTALDLRGGCCAVLSPDGARVAFSATAADGVRVTTAVMGTDGSGFDPLLLADGTLHLGPSVWLTNDELLLQGWDDTDPSQNGIFVRDAAGLQPPRRLTTGNDFAVAASPDGTWIAFVRTPPDQEVGDLYLVKSDGTGERRLSPEGTHAFGDIARGSRIAWSPDGSRIVFGLNDDAGCNCSLWAADVAGGDPVKLLTTTGWITDVRWSPDGQFIATNGAWGVNDLNQLLVMKPDGTSIRSLTPPALNAWSARWSPDDRALLFASPYSDTDQADLWTVGLDGSAPVRLTNRPGHYDFFGWGAWEPPTLSTTTSAPASPTASE
jgi:dipeptidyl aminopeptidase/acylaminoacyl peptidase